MMSRPGARISRGASLIEVLISVLLSAIGLLALAGANVASIRYSKMSQYKGTATMLAADLAERMRANAAGLQGYLYAANFATQASSPTANQLCETYANTCSSPVNDVAPYDLVNWRLVVRSQLPDGSVSVAPSATGSGADVWIAWRDPAVADPNENSTDSRNFAKECPPNFSADKSVRCIYFRINL